MARKLPIADEAIAKVALTALLADVDSVESDAEYLAGQVVKAASDVRFQPSTRRLVLTFDLGMSPTEET